jgi:hypothetical protein
LLLLFAVALLCVGVASASAASSIVGVWSFGGGAIDVKPTGPDTFVGIVAQETVFAECPHPVGQEIWTGITEQTDGSFWGLHQWYYVKTCGLNKANVGPTAWRVKEEPDGEKYLRVCFSKPGTSQPQIPASGPETGWTYGCVSSALIASLPTGGAAAFKAALPPASEKCLSGRSFKIHLAEPRYDPFKTIVVTLKGHKLATVHKRGYVVATVKLNGLPTGAFTVKIKATTVLGVHLSGSRTYHTCAKKPKKHKPAKLKASKPGTSH